MLEQLDVLITSSSRPQLFPYCLDSFESKVLFSGKRMYYIHEDVVFPAESAQVMEWLKTLAISRKMSVCTDPAKGLGAAVTKMLSHITTPFMFYLQEDWEFERYIELDRAIWIMENYEDVNAIIFFKYRTNGVINSFPLLEHDFDGQKMCIYNAWPLLPGLWRTEFVRSRWTPVTTRPEGAFTNQLGTLQQRQDPEYCRRYVGVYLWGPQGDYRYVRHIGNTWRMAKWRLEDGKPGGGEPGMEFDKKTRAPWTPPIEKRPSSKSKTGFYP